MKVKPFKRPKNWRMPVCTLPGFQPNVETRQQKRARRRKAAFKELTKKFGGELRRVRRAMAFALAKRASFQG